MTDLHGSFVPILNQLLNQRMERSAADAGGEIYGCLFAINASSTTLWCSHYVHTDDELGRACRCHTLKATHDFMAAYHLIRASLHSQAANAIRLGCETAWHNAWLHDDPHRVQRWLSGKMPWPGEVRNALATYQRQRHFLYAELCDMAHPNQEAMIGLAPPTAGAIEVNVDILLPVYSAPEIRKALFRLFYALLVAQLDFDQRHLPGLTAAQQEAQGKQTKAMIRFYNHFVHSRIPDDLKLELSA